MPKDRRDCSTPVKRQLRDDPFMQNLSSDKCRNLSSPSAVTPSVEAENMKKWDEVRCPVCLEHPHNAVLLICPSHYKGCRAFMCNTSSRHSNCLDQFIKSSSYSEEVSCPLCRGKVTHWTVRKSARRYMDDKARSCSLESCRFCGTYPELRRHARKEHPYAKPLDASVRRQRDWARMVQQQEADDLRSAVFGSGEQPLYYYGLESTMDVQLYDSLGALVYSGAMNFVLAEDELLAEDDFDLL